jgi:uncharacterized protein YjeT (DUF2065 family)
MLLKYYQVWFPLTSVFALSLHDVTVLICIPLHAMLFPDTWKRLGEHMSSIRHNMKYPPDWKSLAVNGR